MLLGIARFVDVLLPYAKLLGVKGWGILLVFVHRQVSMSKDS